jgi:hypothetical protein
VLDMEEHIQAHAGAMGEFLQREAALMSKGMDFRADRGLVTSPILRPGGVSLARTGGHSTSTHGHSKIVIATSSEKFRGQHADACGRRENNPGYTDPMASERDTPATAFRSDVAVL